MARPLRVQVKEGWYHVTARGNRRQTVFCDDSDRRRFLGMVAELPERFRVEIHAFTLMENHYHLVARTPEANLSQAMQWLHVSHSTRWNWAHRMCGHVFQGRFKAILIEESQRIGEVARYVHLNPVRVEGLGLGKAQQRAAKVGGYPDPGAELVRRRLEKLRSYPWSSWRVYSGVERAPEWLETSVIAAGCGGRSREQQRRALVEYTERPIRQGRLDEPWEGLIGGTILGSAVFAKRVLSQLKGGRTRASGEGGMKRVRRMPWSEMRRRTERLLGRPWGEMKERYGDWGRDGAIFVAVRYGGYRLAEVVAEEGGIEYGTAAQGVRRFERRMNREKPLERFVNRLTRELLAEAD